MGYKWVTQILEETGIINWEVKAKASILAYRKKVGVYPCFFRVFEYK